MHGTRILRKADHEPNIFSQVVVDVVNVLNSLLQWEPENIMVASSSMYASMVYEHECVITVLRLIQLT